MPPRAWNPTRQRQFEHVRESLVARGMTWEKATEIAARTVNKARRAAGECDPAGTRRGARRF